MRNKWKLSISLAVLIAVSFCLTVIAEQDKAKNTQPGEIYRGWKLAVQAWTFHNSTFYEAVDNAKTLGLKYIEAFGSQSLSKEEPQTKTDYQMKAETKEKIKSKPAQAGIKLINYGVVTPAENSEAEWRKLFDFAKDMGIETIVSEPPEEAFDMLDKLCQEYKINLAIHNHPKPSHYWNPDTVLKVCQGRSKYIGACADTGHWMRCGINPIDALKLLSGRIINVHLKDLNKFNKKKAFDVPFGEGKAEIRDILAELSLQDYKGYLVVEHENKKELDNPSPSILKGIVYVKGITDYRDYEEILGRSDGRYSMHGWNHYGPGYFELDERTGVLKSQGGMGLLWYSVRKFKDFVLELDFKCFQKETNSGVFLRIPAVPASNDYINHSFEIQISEAGEGIHRTGAVYDAEAPKAAASRSIGEWNHFKITFQGSRIQVELNGQAVLDWNAEPRGKVKDFAPEGYIGLQNHDSIAPVFFKNICIKELK